MDDAPPFIPQNPHPRSGRDCAARALSGIGDMRYGDLPADKMGDMKCAYSGEDRCAFQLSKEHTEQLNSSLEALSQLDELSRDFKMVGESLKELVIQGRESQREFFEVLRNKTPQGYVPFKTHIVTVLLALGITQLPAIVRILETAIK